jgi:hypothetical protein
MDRNSKEFKELKAKWDKKLEKSGLENIEQEDGNLKNWSSRVFSSSRSGINVEDRIEYYKSVEGYYRTAGQFLHEYKFKSNKEKLIWELHCEGLSVREIMIIMRKRKFRVYSNGIYDVIRRLSGEMKNL